MAAVDHCVTAGFEGVGCIVELYIKADANQKITRAYSCKRSPLMAPIVIDCLHPAMVYV
jgi:hypothetical protein